jgi:hypothetical protein
MDSLAVVGVCRGISLLNPGVMNPRNNSCNFNSHWNF